jgi:hypothetical protein
MLKYYSGLVLRRRSPSRESRAVADVAPRKQEHHR